jgi:hypothetical protein
VLPVGPVGPPFGPVGSPNPAPASRLSVNLNEQARLGTIAYGVYLLHQGMLGLTHGLILHQEPGIEGVDDALVTLFALVLTLTLATLSYNYFEKRIVQMGHAFRYQEAYSPDIRATLALSQLCPPKRKSEAPFVTSEKCQERHWCAAATGIVFAETRFMECED